MDKAFEESWNNYTQAYNNFISARMTLYARLKDPIDRLEFIRKKLHDPTDRHAAFELLETFNPEHLIQIIHELLSLLCSYSGWTGKAQKSILTIRHEWLLDNIEHYAEPFLEAGTYEEYRCLLGLYQALDHDLMMKLAKRAADHPNPDIHEAGVDFLS